MQCSAAACAVSLASRLYGKDMLMMMLLWASKTPHTVSS